MTTYVMSIQKKYEEYLTYKERGFPEYSLSEVRRELFNKIIMEERNILDNEIFLALISEEEALLFEEDCILSDMSRLVSVTKALRKKLGKEDMDTDFIKNIHAKEFVLGSEVNKFTYHGVNWLIDLLLEEDAENASTDFVVRYIVNKTKGFKNIDVLFRKKSPKFGLFNAELDSMTRDLSNLTREQRTQLRTQKICISFALMNYALGDTINARFFLMKAVLLNNPRFEGELIMKFLNNVLLMDSQV